MSNSNESKTNAFRTYKKKISALIQLKLLGFGPWFVFLGNHSCFDTKSPSYFGMEKVSMGLRLATFMG